MNSIVVNYYNPKQDERLSSMCCFCLTCVAVSTHNKHEIILVDGSGLGSSEVEACCARIGATYSSAEKRENFAETYNRGMRCAKGEYITLLASDVFVCKGWDQNLLHELGRTKAWMAAPYLSYSDYSAQMRNWVISKKTFCPNFITFNLNIITRACYEKIGGLCEEYTGNFNDIDYLIRIRNNGGDVIIADAGEVVHYGRATLATSTSANWVRDRAHFLGKHPNYASGTRFNGLEPFFCRSTAYRHLLQIARRLSSWTGRKFDLHASRLEPMFHRI